MVTKFVSAKVSRVAWCDIEASNAKVLAVGTWDNEVRNAVSCLPLPAFACLGLTGHLASSPLFSSSSLLRCNLVHNQGVLFSWLDSS